MYAIKKKVVSESNRPEITSQIYLVTPTHAKRLLEKNDGNRTLSAKTVNRYSKMMAENEWKMNGEPIIIDSNGKLSNGQHRLEACVQSGKPFESLVVEGVSADAFDTLDSGKARTLSDVMSVERIQNSAAAAATTRCLVAYEKTGTPDTRVLSSLGLTKRAYLDRYYESAEPIQRGIAQGGRLRESMQVAKSAAAFCFVKFVDYDEDFAVDFFAGVKSGRGLEKRDPCYVLRERLIKIGTAERHEMNAVEQCAAFFKAFRAYAHNQEIGPRQMTWRRYGPTAESFPTI